MRDALPNASFIGFTGTPIEKTDRNTMAVFGDYIDVYDVSRAVEDGATVKIFYEVRLAKLDLKPDEIPKIDKDFEEVTEGEEVARKEKLKSKWARLEALVGNQKRLKMIAKDIVAHYEQRQAILDGKAMIVGMSRRICVELYNEIIKLRPQWHSYDDQKGQIKVVMTGSANDPTEWQQHIRNKPRREALADRMKDPTDGLKIVIVRDMWLTGFDVPCLHTMYVDKPMQGHSLMQAIARVNRVYKDKPGGLIVDYIGLANELKKALLVYSSEDRKKTGVPQEEAVAIMQEKYEIIQGIFYKFDYKWFFGADARKQMAIILEAMDYLLKEKDGNKRFLQTVSELSKAFALAVPNEEALKITDDVAFFQALRANLVKNTESMAKPEEEYESAIKQIVTAAITTEKVVDLYAQAGIKNPDISILSDDFLTEIRGMPQKNLAMELLRKLLNNEIKTRQKKNLIQSRSFAEMLEKTITKYNNNAIQTVEVINELIELAKKIKAADQRGEQLGLTEDEVAFYDALETNDSAVKVLGDETLRNIARQLAETIRKNTTIDWTLRESVQANLRVMVKRVLRKNGYPPDKQEKAARTVLEQAHLMAENMVNG
jgi:type I restriction enzyme R subunit